MPTSIVKTIKREKKAKTAKKENAGKENVAQYIVLHPTMRVGEKQGVVGGTLPRSNTGTGCEYGGFSFVSVWGSLLQR